MDWHQQMHELVAIAASAACGCEKCFDHHLTAAEDAGVEKQHILRTLKLSKKNS
jgi:AhpD family alkylhydroperoxidase